LDTGTAGENELLWDNEVLIEPVHLQEGHFVARLDRPWIGTPFPLEGVRIDGPDQLEWFRRECGWVVVDLLRSDARFRPLRERTRPPHRAAPVARGYINDEQAAINVLRRARLDREVVSESLDMHGLLHSQADSLIDTIASGRRVDAEEARQHVSRIADDLEKNAAAMVWLTRIKQADAYTAQHCVNVAILAMGLAQALEWPREQIEFAGLAGMLHDLGKMKLEPDILNKPGRLTRDEYEHVKRHPRFGYLMLRSDDNIHPAVAQAVLEHHERPDGNGYPHGRRGDSLQPLSALISVVDAYDAITSKRPYSEPRSHHEALGILWKQRDRQFDAGVVEALIQFLGWITPGTLVRLSSGDHAIVLRASQQHRLWPIVRVLEPSDGDWRVGGRMDLAAHNHEHPERPIRVAEVLPDGALELDLASALRREGDAAER
jgi:HD-GYP domain-containing protein (c-di-GMP phosphodiesterase class II)